MLWTAAGSEIPVEEGLKALSPEVPFSGSVGNLSLASDPILALSLEVDHPVAACEMFLSVCNASNCKVCTDETSRSRGEGRGGSSVPGAKGIIIPSRRRFGC